MSKKITSPKKFEIEVELNDGKVLQFVKETKWTINQLSSYYQSKYYSEWKSVEVNLIK